MKNKKVLIISIVTFIAIVAAVFGYLYFATDLFKTEQQLFYKYLAKTQIMDSDFITQYNIATEKISKNSNSSEMDIDVSVSTLNQGEQTSNVQELLNIKSEGLKNTESKQSYRDFKISSNGMQLLSLKYIKDDNTYGLLIDNVLTKYISVENSNLKELFTKFEVEDVSQLPDSIPTNYEEIFAIDETTQKTLKETYGTIIYNNISEENFYKIVNEDKTEVIGVSLSEQEVSNIVKNVLETAKNDSTLLDLIITKAQMLSYNDVTAENIKENIQSYIEEIASGTYSTDKDFIKLEITKQDKKIIKLKLETNYVEEPTNNETTPTEKKKNTIELDFSEANNTIVSIKENDIEMLRVTNNYLYTDNTVEYNATIEANQDGNYYSLAKMQYKIDGYQSDNITQSLMVDVNNNNEENYILNLSNNITLKQDIQIQKLTTDNSAKLNDMTAEEIQSLIDALMIRIITLYMQ